MEQSTGNAQQAAPVLRADNAAPQPPRLTRGYRLLHNLDWGPEGLSNEQILSALVQPRAPTRRAHVAPAANNDANEPASRNVYPLIVPMTFGSRTADEIMRSLPQGVGALRSFSERPPAPSPPPLQTPEEMERARAELAAKLSVARADNLHQCAICLDEIQLKAIIQPCFHQFCHICLFEWFKEKLFCPVCRQDIVKILYNIQSDTRYDECSLPLRPNSIDLGLSIHIAIGRGRGEVPRLVLRPPNWDQEVGDNPQRFVRVTLIQLLAVLHEKYPEMGFPTRRLDFNTFREAINFPLEAEHIPSYYRCFLYLHSYAPVPDLSMKREVRLSFLRAHATALHRLTRFIAQELDCLRKAFDFTGSNEEVMDAVLIALKTADIKTTEFKNMFRSALNQRTTLKSAISSVDIVEKLFTEFLLFAECPHTEHRDYVLNVQHVSLQTSLTNSTQTAAANGEQSAGPAQQTPTPPAASSSSMEPQSSTTNTAAAAAPSSSSSSTLISNSPAPQASTSNSSASTSHQASTSRPSVVMKPGSSTTATASHKRTKRTLDEPIEIITISSDSSTSSKENDAKKMKDGGNQDSSSDEVVWIPPKEDYVPSKGIAKRNQNHQAPRNDALVGVPGPSGLQAPPRPSTSTGKLPTNFTRRSVRVFPATQATKRIPPPAAASSAEEKRARAQMRHKREIRLMRRIIRNAEHSVYFYRKLLREVQKKYCQYQTILNEPCFAHLEEVFREMYTNSKLYNTKQAVNRSEAAKQPLTIEELQRMLTANGKKIDASSIHEDDNSSTDSDINSEADVHMAEYEANNRDRINAEVISSALKQSKQPKNKKKKSLLAIPRIEFVNHLYSSDSN